MVFRIPPTLSRAFPRNAQSIIHKRPASNVRTAASSSYRLPKPFNEENRHYQKSSPELQQLSSALGELKTKLPVSVPNIINGQEAVSNNVEQTLMPSDQSQVFAKYTVATSQDVEQAIAAALEAKKSWQAMELTDRGAIFLRAAELVAGKYRYELMAATMLGQGKNIWQAEIDAAAELADFFRFNAALAQQIHDQQPTLTAPGHHGRIDYRPLEGFVYAVSPFNFTAIGGNLISGPAILGNVVLWKPSPHSVYASYLVHKILLEAGLPPNVIQFVNGDAEMITKVVFEHREFAALNFTGSSDVFRSLFGKLGEGISKNRYRDFPRMIGETSGKNFHLVHNTADISSAVKHTIRAAFEYAGQKCSACSRIYIPQSQAQNFLDQMKHEMQSVKVGPPEKLENFLGPVIHRSAFNRAKAAIDAANKDPKLEKVLGGTYDDSKGLFVQPSVYLAKDIEHNLFDQELFSPILVVYIYPDAEYEQVLEKIDKQGGGFALTGSVFANDQSAIRMAEDKLRYAAGNFYINCKTTGAVIGQQTFGGSRGSGTNDKAGSANSLMRFVTPRTLKEEFYPLETVLYPSNL